MSLKDEVLIVLKDTNRGKGTAPTYVSAYQILNRLDTASQHQLATNFGNPGKGGGMHFSMASKVAQVCLDLVADGEAELVYMDTEDVRYVVESQPGIPIEPGYKVCALYRAI